MFLGKEQNLHYTAVLTPRGRTVPADAAGIAVLAESAAVRHTRPRAESAKKSKRLCLSVPPVSLPVLS